MDKVLRSPGTITLFCEKIPGRMIWSAGIYLQSLATFFFISIYEVTSLYVNKFKVTFGIKSYIKWVTAHDRNPQRRLLKGYRELH